MAYLALYRKWRPRTFSEVIGQDAIMTALQNQIMSGHIGHAYLFCGTRGCGKTSTAKIFARAVNCLHPVNGNPCNECELCRCGEAEFNIVEIDAASNNGVDNIRDLRDEVRYAPVHGKYKVYIIDEVHMLSASAFNALLKTLEEPPAHVIFILATTEPHKILPTILSRCQRYDFKRISTQDLTRQLIAITKAEGIEADEAALRYIADAADGASRDALSILDQCAAFYMNEPLTLDKVLEVLGAADHQLFTTMTLSLIHKDPYQLVTHLESLFAGGKDTSRFLLDWIAYLRKILLLQMMGEEAMQYAAVSGAESEDLHRLAQMIGIDTLSYYVEELSHLELTLKNETEKRILLEVGLLRLCRHPNQSVEALLSRMEMLEKQMASGVAAASVPVASVSAATNTTVSPNSSAKAPVSGNTRGTSSTVSGPSGFNGVAGSHSASGGLIVTDAQWQNILDRVVEKAARPGLKNIFNYISINVEDNVLNLIAAQPAYKLRIQGGKLLPLITQEASAVLGRDIPVRLYDQTEFEEKHTLRTSSDVNEMLSHIEGIHIH